MICKFIRCGKLHSPTWPCPFSFQTIKDSRHMRHPIIATDLSKGLPPHSHPHLALVTGRKGSPIYQKTDRHPRRRSSNTQILDSPTSDAGCVRRPHCSACAPITTASSSSQTSLNCIKIPIYARLTRDCSTFNITALFAFIPIGYLGSE